MTVSFYGRKAPIRNADFTIVAIPDTQYYSESPQLAPLFMAQTRWIAESRGSLNTVFVTHLGDVTDNGDGIESEWLRADAAMRILDENGIAYNLSPGNHDLYADGTACFFDKYFPVARFSGKPWYGGYLGQDPGDQDRGNKNNFELFSVGALDFIVIHLEPDLPPYAVSWADRMLKQYSNRRAILSTHIFLNESAERPDTPYYRPDGTSAERVWQDLIRGNCNVFMVLNGHYHGQARRVDLNSCGEPVYQILQDYQAQPNGGDGWLRYFTFRPMDSRIDAFTFSPWRNAGAGEFETDSDGQFNLRYDMGAAEFSQIGMSGTINPGSTVSMQWPELAGDTEYEWYIAVSDGQSTVLSPRWNFRTAASVPLPFLSVGDVRIGAGSGSAVFTVALSAPGAEEVVVGFGTVDDTAIAALDYIPIQGNLRFGPGESIKNIRVQLVGSVSAAPARRFYLILRDPINATLGRSKGTCTITGDARPPRPPPQTRR